MSRLLAPALFGCALVMHGAIPLRQTRPPAASPSLVHRSESARPQVDCAEGELPDGPVCVRLPAAEGSEAGADAPATANVHRDRTGRWTAYDQIPRRPDRPADYSAYRYPVPPGLAGGRSVVSGYDLDRADAAQRRGRMLRAVGHGGVDLPQARGTAVKLIALEHQQHDAAVVVYVGVLFGTTVVTRHTVREGGELRDYLLLFGHLAAPAAGVAPGARLKVGDVVGYVGDSGSPELVHLHLEARRVRNGIDPSKLEGGRLVANDVSVVCDPRNVLPLRAPAGPE